MPHKGIGSSAGRPSTRRQHLAIGTESDAVDQPRRPHEGPGLLSGGDLVKANDAIVSGGGNELAVRAESHGSDERFVRLQVLDLLACVAFPDADHVVAAGRGDQRAVRAEAHGSGLGRVTPKGRQLAARGRFPHLDHAVLAGCGYPAAVGTVGHIANPIMGMPQLEAPEHAGYVGREVRGKRRQLPARFAKESQCFDELTPGQCCIALLGQLIGAAEHLHGELGGDAILLHGGALAPIGGLHGADLVGRERRRRIAGRADRLGAQTDEQSSHPNGTGSFHDESERHGDSVHCKISPLPRASRSPLKR